MIFGRYSYTKALVRLILGAYLFAFLGGCSREFSVNDVPYFQPPITVSDAPARQLGGAGVASIVSLGTFHYNKTSNAVTEGFGFNVVNNTTFNTTVNNTLNVTVQWGSNNATNNIYSDIFILNKTY